MHWWLLRYKGEVACQGCIEVGVCFLPFSQVPCLHTGDDACFCMHANMIIGIAAYFRRPHRPRCPEIRRIYQIAGLPVPGVVLTALLNNSAVWHA